MKDGLVRAETLPLVFRAWAPRPAARARVRVKITGTDLLTLDLHASLLGASTTRPPRPTMRRWTKPRSRKRPRAPGR